MCLELQKLCDRYKKMKTDNPKLYVYNEVNTLKYNNLYKQGLDLNLKMISTENIFKIFFFVSRQNKLILMYPIIESINDLNDEYNIILKDLETLDVQKFIKKYCNK